MKKRKSKIHLGLKIEKGKYGYKFDKNNYALIDRTSSLGSKKRIKQWLQYEDWIFKERFETKTCLYKYDWCVQYREKCLRNLELNLHFFKSITKKEFDLALNKFLLKNKKFVKYDN